MAIVTIFNKLLEWFGFAMPKTHCKRACHALQINTEGPLTALNSLTALQRALEYAG